MLQYLTSVKVLRHTDLALTWKITYMYTEKACVSRYIRKQNIPFCQDTFVGSGPRDVKRLCYASLRLRQPKQRVHKIDKTCSHNQVKYF